MQKKNLVSHFEGGRHAALPQKPVVKGYCLICNPTIKAVRTKIDKLCLPVFMTGRPNVAQF